MDLTYLRTEYLVEGKQQGGDLFVSVEIILVWALSGSLPVFQLLLRMCMGLL